MPDTATSQRSDTVENSRLKQDLVPPLALYSEPERNGRIFLRHGDPSTSSTGSTRYLPQFPQPPVVCPPLQLFDSAGRVFRLDLLAEYRIGGSIKYWFDENPMPETFVEGVDYVGELLQDLPNDNPVALESVARTLPFDDMAAKYRVPSQSQNPEYSVFPPYDLNTEYRNDGVREQIYSDSKLTATVPPADVLNTADVVSGHGNSVPRSADPNLSKLTEDSAQSSNFTLILKVPSDKIVPSMPMEYLGEDDIAPVAEPHTQPRSYHSRAFHTFNLNSGHSGDNHGSLFSSSVLECAQPTHFTANESDPETVEERLQEAFLRASIRAMMPPRDGFEATSGSVAVDARAATLIKRGPGPARARGRAARGEAAGGGAARGEAARGGAARGGAARGGAARGGAARGGAARGGAARRVRGTTARRARGRGRAAQRGGHLHSPEGEQGLSEEDQPNNSNDDGNEESGA